MNATEFFTAVGQEILTVVPPRMRILETDKESISDRGASIALMNPEAMKKLFFVSTYSTVDPDSPAPKQHGYQRDPMQERIRGIADYYLSAEGRPTPIILSVRIQDMGQIADFERMFNAGRIEDIHARWNEAVVSVVDGQHRYLGLIKAHQMNPAFDPMAPVEMFYGLSYIDEARLFDAINTTQRKLPKALIEVTAGDIVHSGEQSHAQQIREIAFALARDEDSVWYGAINMTGARDPDRPVTYEGLRRSTSNMFPALLLKRLAGREVAPVQIAKKYWATVASACQTAWEERPREEWNQETQTFETVPVNYRIKELVGVASLAKLGNDILTSALEYHDIEKRMVDMVSKLSEVDWEKRPGNPWMASQAGFAGQRDLYELLYNLVYLDQRPGNTND